MRRSISLRGLCFLSVISLLAACSGADNYPTPPLILGPNQVLVGPDDTVYRIAYQNGVSTRGLIEVNRLDPPYTLSQGRILTLPSAADGLSDGSKSSGADDTVDEGMASLKPLPLTPIPHEPEDGDHVKKMNPGERPPLRQENVLPQEDPQSKSSGSKLKPVAAEFIWPVQGEVIGKFGRGSGKSGQDGIRIAASAGTKVKAVASGKVIYVGDEIQNLGKLVLVQHKGWISAYGHLEKASVSVQTTVKQGDILGTVGKTGAVSKPQLYFELRKNKKPVDPLGHLGS